MKWLAVFFAAHLCLVGTIAAHLDYIPSGILGRALTLYLGVSGSNTRYGFFAPSVGTSLRASFDVQTQNGRTFREWLGNTDGQEASIRIGNLAALFGRFVDDKKMQRSLTASWAAQVFARHPEAKKVAVHVEIYDLPSMAEYREGLRPNWKTMYRGEYLHD